MKYRATICIEFETAANLPDINFSGTMDQVGDLIDALESPQDIEESKATALVKLERVNP